jgi:1,4-alpha-glucan branching enzyme
LKIQSVDWVDGMISKSYYNNGRTCRVTFRVQPDESAQSVNLVSSHDDWDTTARPMTRRKDGSFSTSLVLSQGTQVKFRYLLDGNKWINDDQADDYAANEHGETDGVVRT